MSLVHLKSQRGVSLVEALIAMAIMGFGMLAIVGVQGTLRLNSDVSRQRSEATRIAEQELESLRAFTQVGTGAATDAEFDAIGSTGTIELPQGESNAVFSVTRSVVASGQSKMVEVKVTWADRTGQTREVSMHDVLTRVDPVLSGMLRADKPLTAVGRRNGRHPSIPARAHDLPNGISIFKPIESGTRAWVFNNATGAVTQYCTVDAGTASSGLTNTAGCTALNVAGRLVSGEIRFNLRGAPKNLGTESVMKPIPGGSIAWVIDHSSSTLVRACTVSSGSATADLTAASVVPGLGCTSASMQVAPFSPADATHVLNADDSEFPSWPSLPATVAEDNTGGWTFGVNKLLAGFPGIECHSSAPTLKLSHTTSVKPSSIEYFCLITPNTDTGWGGRLKVVPVDYLDGTGAWTTGTAAGTYRVCRYSPASMPVSNEDHPAVYGWVHGCSASSCRPVTSNLTNQNYLIIDGTKSCPSDSIADASLGNLVNTNTVQHQP